MSNQQQQSTQPDEPTTYQIRVKGQLAHDWSAWFDNAQITHSETGETVLTCSIRDQSALHGLLRRIRDLGLPLISVIDIEADHSNDPNTI